MKTVWPVTFSEIDGQACVLDDGGVYGAAIEAFSTGVMLFCEKLSLTRPQSNISWILAYKLHKMWPELHSGTIDRSQCVSPVTFSPSTPGYIDRPL